MRKELDPKHTWFAILLGALAVPSYFVSVLTFLLPILFGYIGIAWGGVYLGSALAAAGFMLYGFLGVDGLLAFAVIAPASIIITMMLKSKKPWRNVVVSASIAIAVGAYAMICLPSLLAGKGPFDGTRELFLSLADNAESMFSGMDIANLPGGTEAIRAVKENLALCAALAPELSVGVIVVSGMGFGFIDTILARAMLLKRRRDELRPMAPFGHWQLARNYTWGSLLMLVGCAVVYALKLNNADAVFVAVECMVILPLALMGVCLLDFLTRIGPGSGTLRRVASYVLIAVLMPYSIIFLTLMGFMDKLLKIRKRHKARP